MIERCNDCKFSENCIKKDSISHNKQLCQKTYIKKCNSCERAQSCDMFEKIQVFSQCPKTKERIDSTTKSTRTLAPERVQKLIRKYEQSKYAHYQVLNTTPTEDGLLDFRFRCTVCGTEFTKSIKDLRLSESVFSCPNLYCSSRRFQNYSDQRIQRIQQEFSYRYVLENTYLAEGGAQMYVFKCKVCGALTERSYTQLKLGGGGRFGCSNPACDSRFRSTNEIQIGEELTRLGVQYIANDRAVLGSNKELDIYIPSHQLAIEYDGARWHNGKDNYYKYQECREKGIRLIQITEYEYFNKYQILMSFLRSQLDIYECRIGARKCTVREISSRESTAFLNENHLQGSVIAPVRLGLFYGEELVQVMTFGKPRYNKQYQWELLREASKADYLVHGGKSKLLKYFIEKYSPESILSYCSKNKFTGTSYLACGFTLIGETEPGYYYYGHHKLYHRTVFQKHKLAGLVGTLLKTYDETLTADENLTLNGYFKLYTYGNFVFGMNL